MSSFTAATVNLRFDNDSDPFIWAERKLVLKDFIQEKQPDFFGTQEGRQPQLYDLAEALKGEYLLVDAHRKYDPARMYPCLFIRKDWKVNYSQDRWLSETPDVAGSKSFGSRWPKLAVLAEIEQEADSQRLGVASFHFDNESAQARPEQARVLANEVNALLSAESVFLLGDANDSVDSETLVTLRECGFMDPWADKPAPVTYHAFGEPEHFARIDYVLYKSESFDVAQTFVDSRKENFYSDHYYVSAEFRARQ